MSRSTRICSLIVLALLVAGVTPKASGSVVSYDLSIEFSNGTAPVGSPPWLSVIFDDGGTAGSVDLTLTATNLTDAEFISHWMFNLDPALDPTSLAISAPAKTGAFGDPSVSTGVDSFKADGDGFYDIEILFPVDAGLANRFSAGDAAQFAITGIPTLTAGSFDFLSTPSGGQGTYPTAAHAQGIGELNDLSGWVTVPEPASLTLLVIGAGGMLLRRVRRR